MAIVRTLNEYGDLESSTDAAIILTDNIKFAVEYTLPRNKVATPVKDLRENAKEEPGILVVALFPDEELYWIDYSKRKNYPGISEALDTVDEAMEEYNGDINNFPLPYRF